MAQLGNGLQRESNHEDALTVREAELAMLRRVGGSEYDMFRVQNNLASSYQGLGRIEESLRLRREVYSGCVKLNGEEHESTLQSTNNYTSSLVALERFEEARSVLRKVVPVARRVLGDNEESTLQMRWNYAKALYEDPGATFDDLREAVTTLEDAERIARRVLGAAQPTTEVIENELRNARAAVRARETPEP